jgi:hypothetical protein
VFKKRGIAIRYLEIKSIFVLVLLNIINSNINNNNNNTIL